MADNGVWFKLWCSSDDDPDLDNLDVADYGRWCKLGVLTKKHGTDGILLFSPPSRTILAKLQLPDFDALIALASRLPHVHLEITKKPVSLETNVSVSFSNWKKYQGDFSTSRVRKFRQMKRSKRRGEEKRRDKGENAAAFSSSESGNESVSKVPTSPEIEELVDTLKARISERDEAAKFTDSQLNEWRVAADAILRIDKRESWKAKRVLEWSQSDPFWRTNILSMATFRKQYQQLYLKCKAGSEHAESAGQKTARNLRRLEERLEDS